MLRHIHDILLRLWLAVVLTVCGGAVSVLVSCSSHDEEERWNIIQPQVVQNDKPCYLTLNIAVTGDKQTSRASRAAGDTDINNPQGGENGNHTEPAKNHESRINNAALIFYKKSLNSSALTADDKVEGVMYFSNEDFEEPQGADSNERTTKKVLVPYALRGITEADNSYYILVVANISETQANAFKNMTLSELRDFKFTGSNQPMSYNPGGSTFAEQFTSFKMSSVTERRVELTQVGETGVYKFAQPIQVQRLAARIDVSFGFEEGLADEEHEIYNSIYKENVTITGTDDMAGAEGYTGPAIVYRVYEADKDMTTDNEYFVVTGFEVVNGRCTNTYLWKRTTTSDTYPSAPDTYSSAVQVLGTETETSHGATNWVVSPTLNEGNTDLINNYSNEHASISMSDLHRSDRKYYRLANPDVNGDEYTYYALGYYAENTMAYASDARYTKLKLKGYYCKGTETGGVVDDAFTFDTTPPEYTIPIRHSDPSGASATDAATAVMRYGIVRNNIYPVRITMVVKQRDVLYVRYYYYPGGSTQYIEDLATPFYRYIESDTNPGNGPSGTDPNTGDPTGYPNDAPRRRQWPEAP